jgi:hypothetical protein
MAGPHKIEDLKSKADDMMVGERTVIHHAARYGIVRGMTWTVILSALLFWLPIFGPAIAGYVGGRKSGGPFRAIIAIAIPAIVMFFALAAISEGMGMVPTGLVGGTDINLDGVADIPGSTIPLIGSIEHSINSWMASPPDVLFIMGVFAIIGGALSSLRRREEETVIEKVGIPLGELKERIRQEEASKDGVMAEPPSRWEPHPIIAGPAAAHDALNEMVEEIVQQVLTTLTEGGAPGADGSRTRATSRTRRVAKTKIQTGDESPHYSDMVTVIETPARDPTKVPAPAKRAKGARGAKALTAAPRTAKEAIVGDNEDWMVVNTKKGRRPVRVVHSQTPEEVEMAQAPAATVPVPQVAQIAEDPVGMAIAEPEMHIEVERHGLFRRPQRRIVYSPSEGSDDSLGHGDGAPSIDEDLVPVAPRKRGKAKANFERLPIIGPIMSSIEDEDPSLGYDGSLTSLEEPTVHDTIEAGTIAESAAKELAEMARFEDGPDMEPEEDLLPPEARPELLPGEEEVEEEAPKPKRAGATKARARTKPKPKSTARKVKHPTGTLKSRSRAKKKTEEMVYENEVTEVGVVDWEEPSSVEEEDMFNPRHLEDDDEGDEEKVDSEAWAEEERIAAIVRERDEWDRL